MTEHDLVFHVKRFLNENAPLVCALVISALILAACDGDGLTVDKDAMMHEFGKRGGQEQ